MIDIVCGDGRRVAGRELLDPRAIPISGSVCRGLASDRSDGPPHLGDRFAQGDGTAAWTKDDLVSERSCTLSMTRPANAPADTAAEPAAVVSTPLIRGPP